MYFKHKKSLVGVLKSLTDMVQAQNSTLIFKCKSFKHVPIFVQHKDLKFQGLLLDLQQEVYLHEAPPANISSEIINILDTNHDCNLNLPKKSYSELCIRLPSGHSSKHLLRKANQFRNIDLDEISPVEEQDVTISTEDAEQNLVDQNETKVILLEPLLLETLRKESWEKKLRIEESEYKKSVRIVIMYTFAFCGLAITTFFVIYLA